MAKLQLPFHTIHHVDPFHEGGIFDHTGGNKYTPPPPPTPPGNLLLEIGNKILLENGDGIALEA